MSAYRYLRLILGAALLAASTASLALQIKPYSADALAAAQRAGQPVAVQFHADWCPMCRQQTAVLQQLKAEPGLQAMTVLVASFDNERGLRQRMNVRSQGTFVIFRGEQEQARVVGDTAADRIRTALKSAL
jgi:thioredoxin-like negative regulator of GroEL